MKYAISATILGIFLVLVFWFFAKQNPTRQTVDQQSSSVALAPSIIQKNVVLPSLVVKPESTNNEVQFSFAVQADPHMDEQSDSKVYQQTLQNIVSAKPAFLVDLGDIFMVDKQQDKSESNLRHRYTLMKSYYDQLGSLPLYLVMGNHDGEVGWDSLNTRKYRLEYFTNQPDKNYYAFEQNNCLFVMLDPYTYTTQKPNSDGWLWTLGKAQYDWLTTTLNSSKAKYKFVFIHQLVGGDNQGRGGVELAKLYEWGGNNQDGSYGFSSKRPGWSKPIHQLLVENGVNIVFKGHDHFYAKQELDGIIYQTLPQPSHPGDKINTAAEYGYVQGKVIGGSGFLNVSVKSAGAEVTFVGTALPSGQKILDFYSF